MDLLFLDTSIIISSVLKNTIAIWESNYVSGKVYLRMRFWNFDVNNVHVFTRNIIQNKGKGAMYQVNLIHLLNQFLIDLL